MRSLVPFGIVSILLSLCASRGIGQISDYQVKKNFEDQYRLLVGRVDSATTLGQLDTLKSQIDSLFTANSPRSAFLDRALYPRTFDESMSDLRTRHILTYDRVYLIRTQGVHITDLEAKVSLLSTRLDTLTAQRDRLFAELEESRKSVSAMREAVRRLEANLQTKDRLIFALVDSIFVPYDRNLTQVSDIQKEAITRKLEKANVVNRVYEVAADNVRFLGVTQLQGKDYSNLIDQYQQFKARWDGLREKMVAVAVASAEKGPAAGSQRAASKGGTMKGVAPAPPPAPPGALVDSTLNEWNTKLSASFWSALQNEFSSRELTVLPFKDPQSFSRSMRAYVEAVKSSGQDASVFADEVWRNRIDKEWREALVKDGMLGKTEYAALDQQVSELSKEKFDLKFIVYILIVLVIVFAAWWFLMRKPKPKAPAMT